MVMVLALAAPGVASAQPQAQITEARAAFEEAENEYDGVISRSRSEGFSAAIGSWRGIRGAP